MRQVGTATATRTKSCAYRLKKFLVMTAFHTVKREWAELGKPRRPAFVRKMRGQHCANRWTMVEPTTMNYRTGIVSSLAEIGEPAWKELLALQGDANPFLSYAFLHALHESGSASADTGWHPQYLVLWQGDTLAAAMPLFLKSHSYGEYVFDWAWADAYSRHGLDYYPKLLCAVPFTPVNGPRVLAANSADRATLIGKALDLAKGVSSLHVLFPQEDEAELMHARGMLLRRTVQFHWRNAGYADFDDFLSRMSHQKRKNLKQERRKVREAGVTFRWLCGDEIRREHWEFFGKCYRNTYRTHHSTPYLNLDF